MTHSIRSLRFAAILVGVLWSAGSLTPARADAPPANTRPASTTGNWWDTPTPTQSGSRPADEGRGARQSGPYNSIQDYPGAQMGDWVVANAMAARARALRSQALTDLDITLRRVQTRFEHSPEFSDASAAQKKAYDDYTAARNAVLESVMTDPKYNAICILRDQMGDQLAAKRASKDASKEELVAMATLKLQYAADARAIEVTALNADTNLKNAREKMVAASRKLTDLRARFDDSIPDNPELVVARRNLVETRIGVIESAALAQSASIASDYALNYSYYLHRNDNGGTYGPYGANGVYGASFTTPYWGR